MSLHAYRPIIVLLLVVSIIALVWAVGTGGKELTFAIAAVFPLVVTAIAGVANWRALTGGVGPDRIDLADTSQRNAQLMAFIFAWGGLAMFAVYTLTQLWWFHSWQYGLAMLALAAGLFAYAHLLEDETSALRRPALVSGAAWLALVQGIAAVVGLAFLFSTGKLFIAGRTDWPANLIFVCGGIGIAVVSLVAAGAAWRLSRDDGRTAVNGA